MNSTILPNSLEINYRNNHFKNIEDVLNSTICCVICNSDLKKSVILKNDIMLHKIFLCLCCKNCFDKLSDSQNKCVLCSLDTNLKTCEICNRNMCKRCIENFYTNSQHFEKLQNCLTCSTSVLWKPRSEADAVLKCFSLELETRLMLNGEESEDKQNLLEFVRNAAKCDENFTENYIHQIRVIYLSDLLKSKVIPLIIEYEKLKAQTFEEKMYNFSKLCEQVLADTSSVMLDFKSMLNKENTELLNNKVQSLLRNGSLFKIPENAECTSILQNISNVSLDKNIQQGFANELSSVTINCNMENVFDKIHLNPEDQLEKCNMTVSNNQIDVESIFTNSQSNSKAANPNTANDVFKHPEVQLDKFVVKQCCFDDEPESKNIKLSSQAVKFMTENAAGQKILFNDICWNPEICLYKYDMKEHNNQVNVIPDSEKN